MNCPRCGAPLFEYEPDALWLRYWECWECLAVFHLVGGELAQGKTPREDLKKDARVRW